MRLRSPLSSASIRLMAALMVLPATAGCVTFTRTDADPATGSAIDPVELGLGDTSDQPLPDSIEVDAGTLDNGLSYQVKSNGRPGGSVSLRLAVKAGSVDELTPRTGVAHFLEHMMFNGTEKYPHNDLIAQLKRFGAEFGPDINAYTTWDSTVYELTVPNDKDTIEVALDVLDQWLTAATISEEDTVAERGVVLDEWRLSTQTGEGRLYEIAREMYLSGSPFEGRDPIGTAQDIESMDSATLREFYDAWYRPDNVGVVVVGDVDSGWVVDKIAEVFGDAAARGDATIDDTDYEFPLMNKPAFALHSDVEQSTVDVEVTLPLPTVPGNGTLQLRSWLYDQMVYSIMIHRLERDVAAGTAPFSRIVPGTNSFVRQLDAPALYAITDADDVDETLKAVLAEYERTYKFGFEEQELEAAKRELAGQLDSSFAGGDDQQDAALASTFVQKFLLGTPATKPTELLEIAKREIEGVTADGLSGRFNARWTYSAPHVIISTPERDAAAMPSEQEVFAAIEAAQRSEVLQREPATDLPDTLMERPEQVEPSENRTIASHTDLYTPTEFSYPNGAKVVLVPNEIAPGEVAMSAFSPGGVAAVADDDVVDAMFADEIVTRSGVGDLSGPDLAQISSRDGVSVSPRIGQTIDRLSGEARTDSFEVLLQEVTLFMTEPRFESAALANLVSERAPIINDPSIDPDVMRDDTLAARRYNDDPRFDYLPDPEDFETLDLEGAERSWTALMQDASDWVFVFVGDLPDDTLDLVNAYVGNLPATGDPAAPVAEVPSPPSGVIEVATVAGQGDTAMLTFEFSSPVAVSSTVDQVGVDLAAAVVNARLTEVVREKFGDSYSPNAQVYIATEPDLEVVARIDVTGAPERLDAIHDVVLDELKSMETSGITDAEFDAAVQPILESYDFVNFGLFLEEVERFYTIGGYRSDSFRQWSQRAAALTPSDVPTLLQSYFPVDHYIAVSVEPE